MNNYYVYILASWRNWTFYIWVTNDLKRRISEHKEWLVKWFSKKYEVKQLVYYEQTSDVHSAISREKQLKKWRREWKLKLIKDFNINWRDLYYEL